MNVTDAFAGLACLDCGALADDTEPTSRCEQCGGLLDPTYEYDAIEFDRAAAPSQSGDSMWRYADLLPFERDTAVTLGEGATPLVECPSLADELGVERVLVKDEGQNPTGTIADRGLSVAVTAASQHGAETVALSDTGDAGQSAAAYAARADLDSQVYLPSRSGFATKAMVNVHGGEMSVVGGRLGDAREAYDEALAEHEEWSPLGAFETPYRHEGAKTLYYEIVEQLDWTTPDAVVVPTGEGVGLLGAYKAARECRDLGLVDELPALYAAQAAGCAPIAEAMEADRDDPEPVDHPDTICGEIEVPDPVAGSRLLEAVRETDGGAVATEDDAILEAAVAVAQGEGLEMAPSSAVAASGAWKLAEQSEFDGDETVVIVNAGAGIKGADVLRSHLMGRGI
ncbi:threonine synthase [Halobacteria archaeon AArc-dxtr1]|nr:threonine synthase [Halobacteria archaeon AArc-dxtr1]